MIEIVVSIKGTLNTLTNETSEEVSFVNLNGQLKSKYLIFISNRLYGLTIDLKETESCYLKRGKSANIFFETL